MARRCEVMGTGAQTGNKVSHSNRKTKTKFLPNLQHVSLYSETLEKGFPLRVTAATLRSIDKNGGLDAYLLKTASARLAPEALRIKRLIRKAVSVKVAA